MPTFPDSIAAALVAAVAEHRAGSTNDTSSQGPTLDARMPTPVMFALATDDELLAAQRVLAVARNRVDALSAGVAAEIGLRSARELGHDGLAQRLGARTPEALVQRLTGVTRREAGLLVRVGGELAQVEASAHRPRDADAIADDAESNLDAVGWLHDVHDAARSGRIPLAAAAAISAGLGDVAAGVAAADLAGAAALALEQAAELPVEQLAAFARLLRDDLDPEGVADRAASLRERRTLFLSPQLDGMTRISGLLDPESASVIRAAVDSATSPRRGGPRFVDPRERTRAARLADDPRSTEQVAVDALVQLVDLGSRVDDGQLLGVRRPPVQVLVAERDLRSRSGFARIEGQSASTAVAAAERHACETGVVPIVIDDRAQVVDLGRTQRLFTSRQRAGLAARDGGCLFGTCDRPPSWCEAHHIVGWHAEGGRTDIADGVLLCRHHHLLVHDNGWTIRRLGGDYEFIPPVSIDPGRTPLPARSRSPVRDRALGRRIGSRRDATAVPDAGVG